MPNALSSLNLNEYDYVMYVDASGDDGTKFDNPGTSKLYVVACFTCKPSAIERNASILLEIKKLLRCKPQDEMKSCTVCKHKDFPKVLNSLCLLDGYFNCFVVFKEELSSYGEGVNDTVFWPSKENGKTFTSFCHAAAISRIPRDLESKKFLAIVDNMKKVEMDTLNRIKDVLHHDNVCIKYVDSRASGHSLLQVSDILAGMARYAFEEYISLKGYSKNRCWTCKLQVKLCKNKPETLSTPQMRHIIALWGLFYRYSTHKGISFFSCVAMHPPYYKTFNFLDCVKSNKHKKT